MKYLQNSIATSTRSKRPILHKALEFKRPKRIRKTKIMVSASHLYNYMVGDPLVDWLKLRNRRCTRKSPVYLHSNGFSDFIKNRGIEFENQLVKYINTNIMPVISVSEYITENSINKTKELMYKGVPLIHSAPVQNEENGTQGIIDLLIRSDYINKLVDVDPLSQEETKIPSPKLGKPYHYIVIDIKFSTIPLRSDGIHLLNSGSYPAYKAQCLVYTEAIKKIQGYDTPYAFIMGRRWKNTEKGVQNKNYTCLNRLGKISYYSVDSKYRAITYEAIKWVKEVRNNGQNWSLYPPSRKELYPNMCVDSGIWNNEKQKIADKIGEITSIWHVGVKHRNCAITNGVTSWRDINCNTGIMKLNGVYAPIIDSIIDINRQNKDKIRPKIIKNNMYGWKNDKNEKNEIYVDFETLTDIFSDFKELPQQLCTDIIFMIGVGWVENNIWYYKKFICSKPTYEEEYRIMDEFVQFINKRNNPKIYYWCAESRFWNTAENRQFDLAIDSNDIDKKNNISDNWNINGWSDLFLLFKNEPIVIKDCFKFGLKSISKAMYKHNMISTQIDSNCKDGLSAMINAWKTYNTSKNPEDSDTMLDIVKYNEFDCKVLWEILSYLRKNHI